MAKLTTALTPHGYKTLMKEGLVNKIMYYNMNDNYHNYMVTATESLVPEITGSHSQITNSECAFAGYGGLFPTTPSTTEIENITSRVKIDLIKEECSYQFDKTNLNMTVNINPWLNQLSTLTYSSNMQGLTLNLWDYIMVTKQTLNLTTKSYENVKYITDLNVSWMPKSSSDLKNLQLISPIYVKTEGNVRSLIDDSSIRNGSPFFMSFSTYTVNGTAKNNMAGRFSLVTNEFGYWVNNSTFLSVTNLETSSLESYKTVYPAAKVGTSVYYLPKSIPYPTKNGFVGYAINMVNTDGSGKTLMTALIEQATLFMKTYGTYNSIDGTYSLPINLSTIVTNQDINYIPTKFGGNVTINFVYNPADITSDIITFS